MNSYLLKKPMCLCVGVGNSYPATALFLTELNMPEPSAAAGQTVTLQDLERVHFERSTQLKAASEAQFKLACQAAVNAATTVTHATNWRAHQLYQQSRQIENETKELTARTETMQKRVQDWASMLSKFNLALKEMGDIGNWAAMIDRDIQDTAVVLHAVVNAKRQDAGLRPVTADDVAPKAER